MIDCAEAVRRMWAYIEQALDRTPTEELEAHLDTCKRCCGELEFSRQIRTLVAETNAAPPLPADVRRRLERLVEERTAEGPP